MTQVGPRKRSSPGARTTTVPTSQGAPVNCDHCGLEGHTRDAHDLANLEGRYAT